MKCSGCGFENAAGMKFCGECGGALALKCRSCGFENPRGMKFCGECGKSLADPATPVQSPDPRSYTPKHLAEKILTSRSALEGERKQVTRALRRREGSTPLGRPAWSAVAVAVVLLPRVASLGEIRAGLAVAADASYEPRVAAEVDAGRVDIAARDEPDGEEPERHYLHGHLD
jgi:double zinc ribbon protein